MFQVAHEGEYGMYNENNRLIDLIKICAL